VRTECSGCVFYAIEVKFLVFAGLVSGMYRTGLIGRRCVFVMRKPIGIQDAVRLWLREHIRYTRRQQAQCDSEVGTGLEHGEEMS